MNPFYRMSLDIFSSFDDHNKVLFGFFYSIWFITIGVMVSLLGKRVYFCVGSVVFSFFLLLGVVYDLVIRTQMKGMGGSFSFMSALGLVLLFFNWFGLFPYVFSLSSHLSINLSFSFLYWLSIVLMSSFYNFPSFLSHLQPLGSPSFLNPFLCVIELVSLCVRPLTLAVRLTANLSTGHILMGLLGVGFVGSGYLISMLVLFIGVFYFLFEMAVSVIQAYIFSLLPTLYGDEHPAV